MLAKDLRKQITGRSRTILIFCLNFPFSLSKTDFWRRCPVIVVIVKHAHLRRWTLWSWNCRCILPIPTVVNSILDRDFVSRYQWNDHSYILVTECGLSRCAHFCPCLKSIRSGQVFKNYLNLGFLSLGKIPKKSLVKMIFASIFLSKSFECFANYRFIRDSLSSARKWITWNSQSIYVAELASSFSAVEYFGMATITTNW